MRKVKCDANEHYYDADKYSSCPYCAANRGTREATVPDREDSYEIKTEINPSNHNMEGDIPTELKGEKNGPYVGEDEPKTKPTIDTRPYNYANQDPSYSYIPGVDKNPASEPKPYTDDEPKTIGTWDNVATIISADKDKIFQKAPVVGWLVIVEGNQIGRDFRIIPGLNTIGRDKDNTIVIDNQDKSISRNRHCLVEYDMKNNNYYIERGGNNTYLNGDRVGGEGVKLNSGDTIEIGETKLRFIPLCSSEFNWA